MHIWTQLALREGAMLALLLCLGAGPAAWLSERYDTTSRIALAPVLGFSLGTCVATTVLEFEPAASTYWLLVVLALASVLLGAWKAGLLRRGPPRPRLPIRETAQIVAVLLAVAGPLNYALHHAHSTGPASYFYTDVDTYVAEVDGAQQTSLHDANRIFLDDQRPGKQFPNYTEKLWGFVVHFDDKLDAAPVDANLDALIGLGATETNSADLVVLLLIGALAAFGAVRAATRSRTWAAVIAGALFGGPLFLELWFDSFDSAIPGLSLFPAIAVLAYTALSAKNRADLVLLALVVACLSVVYPLFLPPFIATAVVVVAVLALRRVRAGERPVAILRSSIGSVAGFIALSIILDPVAFIRNIAYAKLLANNLLPLPRVAWHLTVGVVPGYVFQTRELWDLPSLGTGGASQLILALVLPILFAVLVAVAAWRYPPARVLILFVAACLVFAEYSFASQKSCTYCEQRDLLPLGPVLAGLMALGIWALLAAPARWARFAGVLGALLVLAAVGQRTRIELTRFINGSYFLDSANRSALADLPHRPTGLLLEGYAESARGQAELPLVYELANEHDPDHVTFPTAANDDNSLAYLLFYANAEDPPFNPDYRYVLTRLAGIETDREVVRRSGAVALERRTRPLDVTPVSGIGVPPEALDPSGTAWIQTDVPLELYVTGPTPGPVSARLTIRTTVPFGVPHQRGVTGRVVAPGEEAVCVPARGAPPVRTAVLRLAAVPYLGAAPNELFPPTMPLEGVSLVRMQAVAGTCRP